MLRLQRIHLLVILVVFAALPLAAQVTSPAGVQVTATNTGAFSFTFGSTTYAFGSVASTATTNTGGTETLTATNPTSTSARFTSIVGVTWNVSSSPNRTVRFHNSSTGGASSIAWGTINSLALDMPVSGGNPGTSCGFKGAGVTGDDATNACLAGQLYRGLTGVGRGASAKSGSMQFQLTVDDVDTTGTNTWVLQVTATGV